MSVGRSSQVLIAEALARQGQTTAAVEACFQARAEGDDSAFVHALLSELLLGGDFYDEAIAESTVAIERDPDCAPAYLALGLAYDRRGGMWDQSVLVWHELAEVVPDLVTAHVQLGEAFMAANFEDEAIDAWRRALELDPKEPRAMYDLAVAALKKEGMATALPGFRRAGELDPTQDDLFFALAGLTPELASIPLPTTAPAEREGRLAFALVLARREDLFGAADLVRASLDETPDDPRALALVAYAYLKQEAVNEAIAVALRALQIDARYEPALYCLGAAYAKRPGLNRHAARVFSALAKAAPAQPMAHVLFAESLLGLQQFSQAAAAYRRAVELERTLVRARFGLAAVYLTEGRHAEADWEVRRAAYYDTRRQGLFWKLYDRYAEGGA